jgi:hypothetical protein
MSLIVTRHDGTTDVTFGLVNQVGTQKNYGNSAVGLVEPEQITLQSFLRPMGARGTDRYKLKASKTFVEDATGNNITCACDLTITIPRSNESGLADAVKDQIAFVKSMLSEANIVLMISGALPDGDNHVDTFNPA